MPRIEHTSIMSIDLRTMNEIPSEYLEPYITTYLVYINECVAFGYKTAAQGKELLKGLEQFVSLFGGLHSRLATSNEFHKIFSMTDEAYTELCKEVYKDFFEEN